MRVFVFWLATELKKTVAELEREMTTAELMEWQAYAMLKNPKTLERLEREAAEAEDDDIKDIKLFNLLSTIGKKANNGR